MIPPPVTGVGIGVTTDECHPMHASSSTTTGRSCERRIGLAALIGLIVATLFVGLSPLYAVGADSALFVQSPTPLPGVSKGSAAGATVPAAGETLPLPTETPQPLPGFFSTLVRLVLALGITIGLIYLTVWGLKVLWEKRGFPGPHEDGKPMKVLSSLYLAPRKTLYLVEVGRRVLVVGGGQQEIHRIDVITDPAEIEAIRKDSQQGFPELFGRFLKKQEERDHAVEARQIVSEGRQAVGDYLERIRKVSRSLQPEEKEDEK